MIGTALVSFFQQQGYHVFRLVRREPSPNYPNIILWDVKQKEIPLKFLEGFDAVIHLSGASIAGHRWTPEYKEEIANSRIDSTKFLAASLTKLKIPPKVFFCASAVGYYGPHPGTITLDERQAPGDSFLAHVCRKWEEASQIAGQSGVRVVNLRFGIVLSGNGGALKMMLPVFKLGLGGKLGSGEQIMSWISLEEIPLIIRHILEHEEIKGPVNCVSPQTVSNKEFTQVLGEVLHRPAIFPVPAFGLRLLFGEMSGELLGGVRAMPKKLLDSGYPFAYPELRTVFERVI